MCKEMLVIPVNKVAAKKNNQKNGGPRRRGTRGRGPKKITRGIEQITSMCIPMSVAPQLVYIF
jgi:hypothetical protein